MAIHPNTYTGQDRMQPGARGEMFQTDIPGYRNQGDRINRTNNKLAVGQHDVPSIKYEFDRRLPALFRYGYAYGYNQIVIPKGRIVAADPYMDLVDFDMKHAHNTLTLANGGAPVRIRKHTDLYPTLTPGATDIISNEGKGQPVHADGKEWTPILGMENVYVPAGAGAKVVTARPFKAAGPSKQLDDAGYMIDSKTGRVIAKTGPTNEVVRPGNKPLGVLFRNEYTRGTDAYNGMMPGAVCTDALIELPWFAYKDKAEQNPWGSGYGGLFPGCLVKSDENGRVIPSPLNFESEVATMSLGEYELERQQVVGEIYSVDKSLIPEGAARWATWALEDRMKFNEFNPAIYRQNNRDGEDAINNSPYNSENRYPGYPYDKAITNNDLHMLGAARGNYSLRQDEAHRLDRGIPGLTDGHNAVVRNIGPETVGYINYAGGQDYVEMFFRTIETNIDHGSLQVSVGESAFAPCTLGATLTATKTVKDPSTGTETKVTSDFLQIIYSDELQGIVKLVVNDKTKADAFLAGVKSVPVRFQYKVRGLNGVPTFLDWDGCIGSLKVLLTK